MVDILQTGPARSPSLHDIELSDAVLILGEDVTNSAPRMALSLRQSVRQQPLEIAAKLKIPSWMDDAVRKPCRMQRVHSSSLRRAPLVSMTSPHELTGRRLMTWLGWDSPSHTRSIRQRRQCRTMRIDPGSGPDDRGRVEKREAASGDFRV